MASDALTFLLVVRALARRARESASNALFQGLLRLVHTHKARDRKLSGEVLDGFQAPPISSAASATAPEGASAGDVAE